ncbi:MAG: 1-acyl-sn-glycerol-3-phosphate acyltransferase [Pseudomonadales bacterium]|nr:1-acyl-sn-glycerol-3-phosphate acyltransferase [Pseudomonadales bacterium]
MALVSRPSTQFPPMDEFQDIRPYDDAEVTGVVHRLLADQDFLDFLGRYDSPRLARFAPILVRWAARRQVRKLIGDISTIDEFQDVVARYVSKIIDETMAGCEFVGLEHLRKDKAYLFISNHRDIAGDSMLVDFVLHQSGYKTVRIAVGDNLLQRPFATDIMKLNKSFFIRRSETGTRKVFAAMMLSSRYIQSSLASGHSVWIAQAEGRAKDGIDETETALVKMLALADRKRPFDETIASLSIVPVTLSYEYDPCDLLKAKELSIRRRTGDYQKPPGEDLQSLATGLGGFKGRVVLQFGDVLDGKFETPAAVAAELDRQILEGLRLYPANFEALRLVASEPGADARYQHALERVCESYRTLRDDRFEARVEQCLPEWRPELLAMYANPIVNKLDHGIEPTLSVGA